MLRQPIHVDEIHSFVSQLAELKTFQAFLINFKNAIEKDFPSFQITQEEHQNNLLFAALLLEGCTELEIKANPSLAMDVLDELIKQACLFAIIIKLQIILDVPLKSDGQAKEVLQLLDKLAKAPDARVNYILGKFFLNEFFADPFYKLDFIREEERQCDLELAIRYLQTSTDLGNAKAALDLAAIYLEEYVLSQSAVRYFERNFLPFIQNEPPFKISGTYDLNQAILALEKGCTLGEGVGKEDCAYKLAWLYREKSPINDEQEKRDRVIYYYQLAALTGKYSANIELASLYFCGDADLAIEADFIKADEVLHAANSAFDYYQNAYALSRLNLDLEMLLPRYLFWISRAILSPAWLYKEPIREIRDFLYAGRMRQLSCQPNIMLAEAWKDSLKETEVIKYAIDHRSLFQALIQKTYQFFNMNPPSFGDIPKTMAPLFPRKGFVTQLSFWKEKNIIQVTDEAKYKQKIAEEISSQPEKLKKDNETYTQTYLKNERMMDWMLFNLKECPEKYREKMLEKFERDQPYLDQLRKKIY